MPGTLEWETFAKWGQEHNSDIIHVNVLGTSMINLNSYKAATELLGERSSNYHSRSGWGFGFITLPCGDVWRASRRMFAKYFNPSNPSINVPRDVIYVKRFLGQLLQKPDDFLQPVRSLMGSTILSTLYSIKVQPYNDPYIKVAEEAVAAAAELFLSGAFLVDIIPLPKYVPEWFPGAHFQKKAAMMRKHAAGIRDVRFAATEKLTASDYAQSFLTDALVRSNTLKPPTKTVIY